MGFHNSSASNDFLAVVVGTTVWTTGNTFGGSYTNVTGTVTITASATNLAQTTSIRDWLVICNESDPPFKVNATSAFKLVAVSTKASTCDSFSGYLVLGNTTEGTTKNGSRIRWSDVNDPDSWPANNFIDIEPDDGDQVVAVKRFRNSLYVLKQNSIHEVIITGLEGAEAFVTRPIARGIGAWAKNSVKVIDTVGMFFLGSNGVYVFDGQDLELISDPIQRKIDSITRSRYSLAVAELHRPKHQYWLSTSFGTDETQNNEVLVYDYIQKSWTVFTGLTAAVVARAEDNNGNDLLFSGDYYGKVYKQDTGNVDEPNGAEMPIAAYYMTNEIHLNSPEIEKSFKYLYVFSKINSSATVSIDAYYDFDETVTDTFSLDVGSQGAIWGQSIWGLALWPEFSTKVSRIDLNRNGKAIKLRFRNNEAVQGLGILGWVLVYNLEDYTNE